MSEEIADALIFFFFCECVVWVYCALRGHTFEHSELGLEGVFYYTGIGDLSR